MGEKKKIDAINEDLKINIHNLDEELIDQPILYMKYSIQKAKAEREVKRSHEHLKIVRSNLIKEAHGKTMENGKAPNVSWVEAYYRSHKDHIEAKEEMAEAEHELNLLIGAVTSFEQRSSSLEKLSEHHTAQLEFGNKINVVQKFDEKKTKIQKKRRSK